MTERAAQFMAKAWESLDSARTDFALGRFNSASNRAYFAMFHAARAVLESRDVETGGLTHSSVLRLFSLHFVKTTLVAREHGRNLRKAEKLRFVGDYDADPPDAADTDLMVRSAEAFLLAAADLVNTEKQLPD